MKFKNTYKLSPVVNGEDLPWEADLFHHNPMNIPDPNSENKRFQEYIKDNHIVTDRAWWKKQYDRCMTGYTIEDGIEKGGDYFEDGWDAFWKNDVAYLPEYNLRFENRELSITGRHYMYLNFWPIISLDEENQNHKKVGRPYFLDIDMGYYLRIALQLRLGKNNLEYKGRQGGFSEKGGQTLGYNMAFMPGTQNLVIAEEETDAENTFMKFLNGFSSLRNTQFYKDCRKSWKPSEGFVMSRKEHTWVKMLATRGNDQALSRYTPFWAIGEEIGKWRAGHAQNLFTFNKSAQIATSKKTGKRVRTGYTSLFGTAGDMTRGAEDVESLHNNPDKLDLLRFRNKYSSKRNWEQFTSAFTSGTFYKSIDKDGNSDFKKGIEVVKQMINSKDTAKARYIERTQNPIYSEDGFESSEEGYFGPDKIIKLNNKRKEFQHDESLDITRRGILQPIDPKDWNAGMKFIDSEDGWLIIAEEPRKDNHGDVYKNLYFPGTDSYDQDEAYTSNSKGSMVVRKGFLSMHDTYNVDVAYILDRPTIREGGAEEFYKRTIFTCIYFGKAQNNIEFSNQRIFDYYKNHGFDYLLMLAPEMALANKVQNSVNMRSNKYGTDRALKPVALAILADDLTDIFISNIVLPLEAKRFGRFKYIPNSKNIQLNDDFVIAAAHASLNFKEHIKFVAYSKKEKENQVKRKKMIYQTVNGRMQRVFVNE